VKLARVCAPIFFGTLLLAFWLQWRGNSYQAEWTGDADEPAHYVTGLMVRDYVTQGVPGDPMSFAQRFFDHYPKVGLGHWPPFFYLIQTAWTLPFGTSRGSLLALMAILTAAVATVTYLILKRFCPDWISIAGLLVLLTSTPIVMASRTLMAEMLVTLLSLLALLALASYFRKPRWQPAALFGVLTALTMLTKGSGIALAGLPILGVAFTGNWPLARRRFFWLPVLIVFALCGPWYALAKGSLHERVAAFGGPGMYPSRLPTLAFTYLPHALGWPAFGLAVAGIVYYIWMSLRIPPLDPLLGLSLALIAAFILGHLLIGVWVTRHLVTILPTVLLFACFALNHLLSLAPVGVQWKASLILVAAAAFAVRQARLIEPKLHVGFDQLAESLAHDARWANSEFLFIGDPKGEGCFVAEVAGRERRPGHTVLRGSKLLVDSDWMGRHMTPRFNQPLQLIESLASNPEFVMVIDWSAKPGYAGVVIEALRQYPEHWQLVSEYSRSRGAGHAVGKFGVYRFLK
jgi:hypothetical protein